MQARVLSCLVVSAILGGTAVAAQSRSGMRSQAADVACPSLLGEGVDTKRSFCDVLIAGEPAEGVLVTLPAHSGAARLTFDLHNRHTYSEQQVESGRAFARYTASIGVLTRDGRLLERGVVQSEFRTAADLVDRISGGAGPGGVKAVAPTGTETVSVEIPAAVTEVSILGERLDVLRLDGRETFTSAGRPIATISNVTVEFRPAARRR